MGIGESDLIYYIIKNWNKVVINFLWEDSESENFFMLFIYKKFFLMDKLYLDNSCVRE